MTYFIGIDISKFKHDFFIMDENGVCVHNSSSFKNNKEGFDSFYSVIQSLDPSVEKRIGFEATGHYGTPLKCFLDQKKLSYMEFHPLLLKEFSKSHTLRRTKTDKKDAATIALYLSTVPFKPYPNKAYHIDCLKSLTRTRETLVKERSKQIIFLTNVLDKVFPELKPSFNDSLKSATCLYLLQEYMVPSKMARMNIESYNKMKAKLKHTISYAKFLKIKELAKNTIGTEDPILQVELKVHLNLFNSYNAQIEMIEANIQEEMSQISTHILSIKGIGLVFGSGIFAEIGNANRFRSSNALLAYAGLEPSTDDSGKHNGKGVMVKHGSSYLRMHLMRAANMMLIHNPVMYEYYRKKRSEGKAHNVALSHVAKKLVRIIYTLETKDIDFDISLMR